VVVANWAWLIAAASPQLFITGLPYLYVQSRKFMLFASLVHAFGLFESGPVTPPLY
jgi:hypothetical protein